LQPSAVLLENRPDMAPWDDGAAPTGGMQALRRAGNEPKARGLDAVPPGVPPHRAPAFFFAPRPKTVILTLAKRRRPTLRDAIGDLPGVTGASATTELRYSGPSTTFQKAARRGVARDERSIIYDHWTRGVRKDDEEAFRLLRPGGTYKDLPQRLQ